MDQRDEMRRLINLVEGANKSKLNENSHETLDEVSYEKISQVAFDPKFNMDRQQSVLDKLRQRIAKDPSSMMVTLHGTGVYLLQVTGADPKQDGKALPAVVTKIYQREGGKKWVSDKEIDDMPDRNARFRALGDRRQEGPVPPPVTLQPLNGVLTYTTSTANWVLQWGGSKSNVEFVSKQDAAKFFNKLKELWTKYKFTAPLPSVNELPIAKDAENIGHIPLNPGDLDIVRSRQTGVFPQKGK